MTVAVRVRPLSAEDGREAAVRLWEGRNVGVSVNGTHHSFDVEYAFGPATEQEEVYDCCAAPLVEQLVCGYNCTIFAYGQTGSGKSHTMSGSDAEPGIIPRVAHGLFELLPGGVHLRTKHFALLWFEVPERSLHAAQQRLRPKVLKF